MNFRGTDKKNIISFIVGVILLIWYFFMPVGVFASCVEVKRENNENSTSESELSEPAYYTVELPEYVEWIREPITPKEEEVVEYQSDTSGILEVPSVNTNFKSFTYYTSLNRSSTQWRLQTKAYTDSNGLRKIDNYYLVAVGTYYSSTIGDLFRFTTEYGNVFEVIVCDIKADAHTDSKHQYTRGKNPCMVEFYVAKTLDKTAKVRGTIGALSGFEGSITKVEKIGRYNWE